jgi:DNA polymerase III subunit chi
VTEVLFYHLDRMPLEKVLPELLEKCLERGWKTVVQLGSEERRDALDGPGSDQLIWLTSTDENPNEATVRFLADGASVDKLDAYQRVVLLFDGNDEDAVMKARETWKQVKADGHDATYWQQSERGRWEKKA